MSEECQNFLSSSDKDQIKTCHEAKGHVSINLPGLPPGTVSQLAYVNKIGEEQFTRVYGFDSSSEVVVIIETRGKKIDREGFLGACRNTSQWYWELRIDTGSGIEKQWHPVPTIPGNSNTNNPKHHRNAETESDANAYCLSLRNGNRLVGYDQSWTGDPESAFALTAEPAIDKIEREMEDFLDRLEQWVSEREA